LLISDAGQKKHHLAKSGLHLSHNGEITAQCGGFIKPVNQFYLLW